MDIDDKRLCIVDIHDVIVDTDYNIHAHQKGTAALHRSFSVLLFNTKNELMLKKLPLSNPLYPGYIDNSCHSHPYINKMSWDDPSQDCAMQASDYLKREFGIDVKADELTLQDRLLYKSDDKTGNMGFLGRNFLIHDVDRNILEKDLGLVPKMFYASNFVDHEINYLFSYMGDFEIVPNLSEYSEVFFVDRKKLELIVERPECTPWLKAAQKNITLFNLNIKGSVITV